MSESFDIVDPRPLNDELTVESALRPRSLDDFVGQVRVREQLGLVLSLSLIHI